MEFYGVFTFSAQHTKTLKFIKMSFFYISRVDKSSKFGAQLMCMMIWWLQLQFNSASMAKGDRRKQSFFLVIISLISFCCSGVGIVRTMMSSCWRVCEKHENFNSSFNISYLSKVDLVNFCKCTVHSFISVDPSGKYERVYKCLIDDGIKSLFHDTRSSIIAFAHLPRNYLDMPIFEK